MLYGYRRQIKTNLLIIDILKEQTDEDHYLTTSQLCAILKNEYGIETHRTTIKSNIEMLQQAGIGIQAVRSTQNQYNFIERDFDIAELKLLIDAVQSAKFMTKAKSDQLVTKLTALALPADHVQLAAALRRRMACANLRRTAEVAALQGPSARGRDRSPGIT